MLAVLGVSLDDGGTGPLVDRCPALRPEAHPHSGPFQGFFESHQKYSTRLSEAAGTDCEPNRSALLAKQQHQRAILPELRSVYATKALPTRSPVSTNQ